MTNDATDPAAYKFWATEHVRFADLDMLGHVNNKAFFTFAESGRVAFLRQSKMWMPGAARQNVIRKAELEYLRELHYPAEVRVGLRVLKLGSTSFTLGIGMFSGEHCVATAQTVLVRIDAQTRAPVALINEERAALLPYLAN
jgi:acyl-CoA thioester hydrolase